MRQTYTTAVQLSRCLSAAISDIVGIIMGKGESESTVKV